MTSTPIVLAWSGGKDSSLALQRLLADPRWRVVALLTTVTEGYERISMHGVRVEVLRAQVDAIGLPLQVMRMPQAADNGVYERAFTGALAALRAQHEGLRHIAFGDLFLADVRAYRERLLAPLGWQAEFPLWGEDTTVLAQRFVGHGFRAVLTCVDTRQLEARFTGREFDPQLLADLPAACDPCGERGEFHTLVFDGPVFTRPLHLRAGDTVLRDGRFSYADFLLAEGAKSVA